MHVSKQDKGTKQKIKIDPYAVVFSLYIIALAILFFYSLRFLKQNINLLFLPIEKQNIEEKFTALDLENYHLLENKLALRSASSSTEAILDSEISTSTDLILGDEAEMEIGTGVSDSISEDITISQDMANLQEDLKISIVNSTKTSGLAAKLKTSLENIGYLVSNISSQTKTENTSLIMIKNDIENLSEAEIKLIEMVGNQYEIKKEGLPSDSPYDIVIIIGSK